MDTMNITFILFILRLLSLGIGVVDIVLIGFSYAPEYYVEMLFFIVVIICVIFSLLILCGYLSEMMKGTMKIKYMDICFHIGGGIVLLITAIFMMGAVLDKDLPDSDFVVERTIAALFGIQNALIYGVIGVLIFKTVPTPPSLYGDGLEWEDPLIETIEAKKLDFGSITKKS